MTGYTSGHLKQEENGPSNMKREEAEGEEKGDGDDCFDGFAPLTGIRGVSAEENRHPLISSQRRKPLVVSAPSSPAAPLFPRNSVG